MTARPSHRSTERPKNDFLKLVGTALVLVAALAATAFWAGKHNVDQIGLKRMLSAILYLFVGAYALYVTGRHRRYVSRLPESVGTRKIKRLQTIFLIGGLVFLLGAAWNFWLLASAR